MIAINPNDTSLERDRLRVVIATRLRCRGARRWSIDFCLLRAGVPDSDRLIK
jgi:hypothetical protein